MAVAPPPVDALLGELRTLERAYSPGHHGVWAARRRAELVDGCLRALFARAGAPPRAALAAVGGYGRGRLLPRSDIDLLILHEGGRTSDVATLAEELLYPLWDAGFEVGHAVRTPEECREACDRLETGVALLETRHLAGHEVLVGRARREVEGWARRAPDAFVRAIEEDAERRADRFGSAAHLLEPDLKEGAGGWRDLRAIDLIDRVLGPSTRGEPILGGREREALAAAEEFLTRARSALHLQTGRHTERLVLDHQPDIARAMCFEDEPRLPSIDGLMRTLFEHTRQVEFLRGAVIRRSREADGSPKVPPATPAEVLELLAETAEQDREPAASLLDAIRASDAGDEVVWDHRARAAFARLLRAGDRGAASLEVLDRLELLDRFLPGWREVRCRPQRDPYHRFTVDAHLTHTLRAMGRILAGDAVGDDPVRGEALAQIEDPDALLLGALLHDIGKTGEGGHVPVGARTAGTILERMGVEPATRDLVGFMVTQHLLLPDTATRRDLTDENLILDVAAQVGTPDRLAALYLLAEADATATGPAAWTPWRRTLIRELVAKVQHVLERAEMGTRLAEELTGRIDRIRELLRGEPPDEVDRFVMRMPRGYFLSVEPARAARHFRVIAPEVSAREVRAVHHPGVRPGTYELLVVAHDRPGLLSWIAGAHALAGLSILTAQAFTTADGVAADLFEVQGAWEAEIPDRRWREFRTTLRRAVEGTISLERRVDEKRRWYPAPKLAVPVTVRVDNEASDFSTVIEVGAPDRLGLLYDIARTFVEFDLDVHLAKVATYEGRVVDSFYVRDAEGRKVAERAVIQGLDLALQDRLKG